MRSQTGWRSPRDTRSGFARAGAQSSTQCCVSTLTAEYMQAGKTHRERRECGRESAGISVSHVEKRLRAYRGCLGVKCRRRTWYTAKSSGEPCAGARAGDVRMGKPGAGHAASPGAVMAPRREPGELKHLSTSRKREYSASSGERKRRSPNRRTCMAGLQDSISVAGAAKSKGLGRPTGEGESPVDAAREPPEDPEYHGAR